MLDIYIIIPSYPQNPRRGAVRLKESVPRYSARQPRVHASSYRDCVSLHHWFVRHPVLHHWFVRHPVLYFQHVTNCIISLWQALLGQCATEVSQNRIVSKIGDGEKMIRVELLWLWRCYHHFLSGPGSRLWPTLHVTRDTCPRHGIIWATSLQRNKKPKD